MEKEVLLAGFHAVNARVKLAPETVRIVYVDSHRHDKRMTECRARLQEKGVRVAAVASDRLDAMARGVMHQGIVAFAEPQKSTLTFDDLLDQISPQTLLLILDGVTDPRNFGACLSTADAAGVQAVIVPKDRSGRSLGDRSCDCRDQFSRCYYGLARCRCNGHRGSRPKRGDAL